MKIRKQWIKVLVGSLAMLLLVSGCSAGGAAQAEGDFVSTSAVRRNTLAAVGDTLYALTEENGEVQLHAFDREKGTHAVTTVEVQKSEEEMFATMQGQAENLATDGKALYAMGAQGSGGIYRIDPNTGKAEKKGFYPGVSITCWAIADGTAYIGGSDAEGISVYAVKPEQFALFAQMGEPVLHFDDGVEIGSIDPVPEGLLVTLKVGEEPWNTVLFDPKNGKTTPVAQDVYSDRTAQNGSLRLACLRTEDGAQAVLLEESGPRVAAELDWLYRPIAAGKGFVLDSMGDKARTTLYVDETGAVHNVTLPDGAGPLLGGDARYAYLWDTAAPNSESTLLTLDLETLEVVDCFE